MGLYNYARWIAPSFLKAVWVDLEFEGTKYTFFFDSKYADLKRPVKPNDIHSEVTITYPNGKREAIEVNQMDNKYFTLSRGKYGRVSPYIKLETNFGLEVQFIPFSWMVSVDLPTCFMNQVEGLCGNYDGDKN